MPVSVPTPVQRKALRVYREYMEDHTLAALPTSWISQNGSGSLWEIRLPNSKWVIQFDMNSDYVEGVST